MNVRRAEKSYVEILLEYDKHIGKEKEHEAEGVCVSYDLVFGK